MVPAPGRGWRAAAVALTFAGAVLASDPGLVAAARTVTFRAADGVALTATWHEPSQRPAPAVILVHMLGRTRRDWDQVGSRLASAGIGALAVDLRGHGDSQRVPAPASSEDLSAMVADVAAARRYLQGRSDVQPGRIGIAGASFGASLAVLEASADTAIASLALLSPALDYRGLRIEAAARKYGSRPLLLVSSDEDGYAGRSVSELQKGAANAREALRLSQAGHGTAMLGRDPGLVTTLVEWFRRTL